MVYLKHFKDSHLPGFWVAMALKVAHDNCWARGGDVAQLVEYLASPEEAIGSTQNFLINGCGDACL